MSRRIRFTILAALLPVAWAAACHSTEVTSPELPSDVQALKSSLAPYTSLALAKSAGYVTPLTDCMSNGDEGAMGIHYANTALIDAAPDALRPEALIYEPGTNGEMSLVGVEFIVPFAVVPKRAPAPTLFGQRYSPNDVFGVWALHVWTHRTNPSGLFAAWNPRVHC